MQMCSVLSLCLAAGFAAGCVTCQATAPFLETPRAPAKFKAAVLRHLPIGTPLDRVQTVMSQNGFTCTTNTNATFFDYSQDPRNGKRHDKINFIECKRAEQYFLGWRSWVIAFLYEEDEVRDVLVQVWAHNFIRDGI